MILYNNIATYLNKVFIMLTVNDNVISDIQLDKIKLISYEITKIHNAFLTYLNDLGLLSYRYL